MNPRNGLAGFVRRYPTPIASDNRDRGNMDNPSVQRRLKLKKQVSLGQIVGGQPNPEFVEWLMGWPMGWSDLQPLATDRFQRWLSLHGERSWNVS
jgi:DNA (cytosine-5)-methyltransferase 1